jgi:hypothetical protein
VHVREAELAHHVEQRVEDAVDIQGRRAVEQIEAVERAVIVMEMRDEDRVEPLAADRRDIEAHVRKRMAVAAERVLEDGVEGDRRALAREYVPRMQDARNGQAWRRHWSPLEAAFYRARFGPALVVPKPNRYTAPPQHFES